MIICRPGIDFQKQFNIIALKEQFSCHVSFVLLKLVQMVKKMEPVAHLPREGDLMLIVINNTDTHGSMRS